MERRKIIFGIIIFLLFANIVIWYAVFSHKENNLTVAFLNVGQGDAIFIEAPNGNQVLIDGGPANGAVLSELGRVMALTDRFIDVVIATHPDADHIGGLYEVFKRFEIGLFIDSGLSKDTNIYLSEEKLIAERNIQRVEGRRGMKLNLGDGVELSVLYPDRDLPDSIDANDGGIVAKLSYKEQDFLFTADVPQKIERYLTHLDGKAIDVEVLKAGHHGSKTSSGKELLAATTPDYTIISAGKNNRYGHPHPDVLARLATASTTILRTDELGTIIFETNGEVLHLSHD